MTMFIWGWGLEQEKMSIQAHVGLVLLVKRVVTFISAKLGSLWIKIIRKKCKNTVLVVRSCLKANDRD